MRKVKGKHIITRHKGDPETLHYLSSSSLKRCTPQSFIDEWFIIWAHLICIYLFHKYVMKLGSTETTRLSFGPHYLSELSYNMHV